MGILGQVWLLFSICSVIALLGLLFIGKNLSSNAKLKVTMGAFIAVMIVNYLTASGLISGYSQSEISQNFQTLITPAGYTFSIWGVIYGLLFVSLIYYIWKKADVQKQEEINRFSYLIWMMFALNIAWNIVFSLSMIALSFAMILAYWVVLVIICYNIGKEVNLLNITFGVHLGWISVATIVNFFAMLVQLNGGDLQGEIWYIIALLLGVGIGAGIMWFLKNGVAVLAMAWAYLGIYMRLNNTGSGSLVIKLVALAGIVALVVLSVLTFWRMRMTKVRENV